LFQEGVNVQPIIYPAVPERAARLRFFLSALHDEAQLRRVVAVTTDALRRVAQDKFDLTALAAKLARG
jgi:8-amino-7-oxononanoate synthase